MMDKDFCDFLCSILRKIEEVESMMRQSVAKHIPAYHKLLGVQQKLETLPIEKRQAIFFKEIIKTRGALTYFLNGRYDDGMVSLMCVKQKVINLLLENERNKNSQI